VQFLIGFLLTTISQETPEDEFFNSDSHLLYGVGLLQKYTLNITLHF